MHLVQQLDAILTGGFCVLDSVHAFHDFESHALCYLSASSLGCGSYACPCPSCALCSYSCGALHFGCGSDFAFSYVEIEEKER